MYSGRGGQRRKLQDTVLSVGQRRCVRQRNDVMSLTEARQGLDERLCSSGAHSGTFA